MALLLALNRSTLLGVFQSLSVNSFRPRRTGGERLTFSHGPRDPKRFGLEEKWGLGTRQIKADKLIYTKSVIKYKEIIISYIYTTKLSYRKCTNCITTLSRHRVLFQSHTSSLLAIIFNPWHDTHFHIYTHAFSLYKTHHQTNHSTSDNPCTL